ncbi:MAG: 2-oxo acid dehydrogenase subunit E2 [Chloroflexi bacterium]|nr:2-oxo acid dehydrogenase subunit E2 [Chloroflexota bacterium]
MATAIRMPQLGLTMTEATVVRWLKQPGDQVERDEGLAEIETDKLTSEVLSTTSGVLRRVIAPEGVTVPVTGLLAVVGAADEPEAAFDALIATELGGQPSGKLATLTAPDVAPDPTVTQPSSAGTKTAAQERSTLPPASPAVRPSQAPTSTSASALDVRASPLARRLAREWGVDLRLLRGTGPLGRIMERDVVTARSTPQEQMKDGLHVRERRPLAGLRRRIAERMVESAQRRPQVTLTTEADATRLVELHDALITAARVYGLPSPTYTDLLVFLSGRSLPTHPLLNSSVLGDGSTAEIVIWEDVNIGVVVALEDGLLVPVIRGADRKSLQAISAELRALRSRAAQRQLQPADLEEGTFTLTNLGTLEVDAFTPLLNPPQCAILGTGRIVKKPTFSDEKIIARHFITLSLTFDHRAVDGAQAAAFLRDVKRAIERISAEQWPASESSPSLPH